MKRILPLLFSGLLIVSHLLGQKDLPTFAQYSEHFLNAGKCDEIIIKGNTVYAGSTAGLLILDISDIENPEVMSCYFTDKYVHKIFVRDDIAFVTTKGSYYTAVHFIDVSDPTNPFLVNSIETDSYNTNKSILVEDSLLFLGMDHHGLYIYDISDLLNPNLITKLPNIKPIDMVIKGNYIHMAANQRYFGILDISTISNPVLLCWIKINTFKLSGIDIEGEIAYVAGDSLFIYNISDPTIPNQLCDFGIEPLKDIIVNDSIVYTISEDSLFLINIINPETPVIIYTCLLHGTSIDVEDDVLVVSKDYTNDDPYGIGFFSIADNQSISLISEHYSDYAKEVFIKDEYAYIANGYSGLFIMDIKDPSHPVLCSKILEGIHVLDVLLKDIFAYIRTPYGFHIIDVSDPYHPNVISCYNITHYNPIYSSYSIGVYNDYVYIGGDGYYEIYVFDVSDLSNPIHIGFINVNDWSPGISVYEDHLYVAGYWGGLEIFDIGEDPVHPDRVSYYPLAFAFQVCPGDNKVFVNGAIDQSTGGTLMFHLPDPSNLIYAGNYSPASSDLYYSDSYLFAPVRTYLDLNSSIHIINVQNVYNPFLVQEIFDVAANAAWYKDEIIYAVEDFKFRIFGDSVSVSIDKPIFLKSQPEIQFYPNPATDIVHIKSSRKILNKVQLLNISGQVVFEKPSASNYVTLNVARINPGIYIVRVITPDQVISRKMVIN